MGTPGFDESMAGIPGQPVPENIIEIVLSDHDLPRRHPRAVIIDYDTAEPRDVDLLEGLGQFFPDIAGITEPRHFPHGGLLTFLLLLT
jgi:hypothetical protein